MYFVACGRGCFGKINKSLSLFADLACRKSYITFMSTVGRSTLARAIGSTGSQGVTPLPPHSTRDTRDAETRTARRTSPGQGEGHPGGTMQAAMEEMRRKDLV